MTKWTREELTKIGNAENVLIASRRADGSLRDPVIIWVVRLGDELYVRAINGRSSAWFSEVETRHEGHIRTGEVEQDVTFVEEYDNALNDRLDEAYRKKYRRQVSDFEKIISGAARNTTIRLALHAV